MDNTTIDPQEVLKDNIYFQILNKYAWRASKHELRNKAWLTGTCEFTTEGEHVVGSDKVNLHFLFESEFRGQAFNNDNELVSLSGLIVKDRHVVNSEVDIKTQIIENYEKFFDQVMKSHFTNQ